METSDFKFNHSILEGGEKSASVRSNLLCIRFSNKTRNNFATIRFFADTFGSNRNFLNVQFNNFRSRHITKIAMVELHKLTEFYFCRWQWFGREVCRKIIPWGTTIPNGCTAVLLLPWIIALEYVHFVFHWTFVNIVIYIFSWNNFCWWKETPEVDLQL